MTPAIAIVNRMEAAAAPEEGGEEEKEEKEGDSRTPRPRGILEHGRWAATFILLCGAIACMFCGNKCEDRMPGRHVSSTTFCTVALTVRLGRYRRQSHSHLDPSRGSSRSLY